MSKPDAAGTEEPWQPPAVQSPAALQAAQSERRAALDTLREDAHKEGYEAGLAAAAAQIDELSQTLRGMLEWLARPLEKRSEEVEAALLDLVGAISQQVLRREMNLDPGHLVGVIREAMSLLPVGAGNIEILVHPEDASLLETALSPADEDRAWELSADPLRGRGEFQLVAGASEVDGSLETRLTNVLTSLAGERRQSPRGAADD